MTRSAADVRNDFLEFFRRHDHAIVPGSPVVPYDDPTLLFTNAGMNQFKDVFLGTGTRAYRRAANTQPCIRAGGKHNDLDDVGQDTYHHTFFEMLGNWSFGDYFKKEAIAWAWELLTGVWGLEKDRLHATYFQGDESEGLEPDLEAKELWAAVTDIDPTHIHPGSKKDNFWEMGDVGPCGPCSEIHIDLTPDKSGISLVNAGGPRVIELWNLVFIQFNRDAAGKLTPLPAKHVDTGMGFERVVALLQGKTSNYDTDVFTPIFQAIRDITGAPPYRGTLPGQGLRGQGAKGPSEDRSAGPPSPARTPEPQEGVGRGRPTLQFPPSDPGTLGPSDPQVMLDVCYRVIADHIRCLTFALNDGCVPDREGRGYVLRRILRRAVRYGWQHMNMHEPFIYKLVPAVVETLGDAFPQLKGSAGVPPAERVGSAGVPPAIGPERVAEILREEEQSFDATLDRGIRLFNQAAMRAVYRALRPGSTVVLIPARAGPGMPVNDESVFTGEPDQTFDLDGHYLRIDSLYSKDVRSRLVAAPAIRGDDAFKLHDTYGFPIDLTQMMAEEKGLRVDIAEYERLMEEARERARTTSSLDTYWLHSFPPERLAQHGGETKDIGKYETESIHARVTAIATFNPNDWHKLTSKAGETLAEGSTGAIVADRTCFYSEQGGQIGDSGEIRGADGRFVVSDTQRFGPAVVHVGTMQSGSLRVGEAVTLRVDRARRQTMRNHTATHVMNWALREVLGDHVQQKGSLVDPEKTRFDFSHPKPMTPQEIERVEQLVNDKIRQNLTVYDEPVPQEQALKIHGLRAVFGEKYPDVVRVMSVGVPVKELLAEPDSPKWRDVSIELCGGTHCKSTGQIERFAIVSEEAVAKGIRRVVGITGQAAQHAIDRGAALLRKAETLRSTDRLQTSPTAARSAGPPSPAPPEHLAAQVAELQQAVNDTTIRVVDRLKLRDAISDLQKLVKEQQKRAAAATHGVIADRVAELLKDAPKIGETTVVVAELPDLPLDQLKTGADMIKQKCKSAAVLFGVSTGATAPSEAGAPSLPGVGDASSSEPEAQARDVASAPSGGGGVPEGTAQGAVAHPSEPEAQARAPSEAGAPARGTAHRPVAHPSEPEAPARARSEGKALLLAAMSNDLVKKGLKAGDLIKRLAPIIDGRGGGPPTMAQAGGKDPSKLADALEAGRKWIQEKLG